MCLAVPGKILSVEQEGDPLACRGLVDFDGVRRRVEFALLEDPRVGEYVLVHGGVAMERLRPEEARRVRALLDDLVQSEGEREEGV